MTKATRILAFDASGRSCGAAVTEDGRLLARRLEPMERGQAERLVPMIEQVLDEAGLSFEALDAIAVTLGPGAFTGVRIGLAAARGFALALGLPQVGVSSLEALAASTSPRERRGRAVLALIDAKRADFFAQLFDTDLLPLGEPFSARAETLAKQLPDRPLLVAGDAFGQARPALDHHRPGYLRAEAPETCDPATVARLAASRLESGEALPRPRPLYLRAPDVTLPKAKVQAKAAL